MDSTDIKLNKEQKEAVFHESGPLLIVAGAGTGKTALITSRIAYLIKEGIAKSDEILALTFTEKAAGEMEERVDNLLPLGYFDLWISTFHSFAEKVLRQDGLDIGLPANFKLLDEFEQYSLMRRNLDKFDLDYYRPMGNQTKFIQALLSHFSRLKDEDISQEEYLDYAEGLKQNLDGMLSKKGKAQAIFLNADGEFDKEIAEFEVKKINEAANAYHVYQQLLLENSALDFGDLINYSLKLFRERPNILEKYRARFKYVLVDEFQDTNWAQYELVKLLAGPKNNLAVVGDDDQCLPGDSLVLTKSGKKRINSIKKGDMVATAVGRGYLSYSKVSLVSKNKKKAKLLTFRTLSGKEITVTDNHKMFCYIPVRHNKEKPADKSFYVYLMHKQELGWRLGITSNLAVRLKLERSADRIVAVRSFEKEEEARFHEALWSLRYGIPTVCFAERGGVLDKRELSDRLYKELSVEKSVIRMVDDLNIDLEAHQFCLNGVVRGAKIRIKINLEMCCRNYRSKYAKNNFLQTPQVLHLLSVETSHLPTIKKLKKAGFKFEKAKIGERIRIASSDLGKLGKLALKIQKISGGIIENSIKIGRSNIQTQKALIVPAKNVLPGMSVPVFTKEGIVYDKVIERTEKNKTLDVYDLEIERTHNFLVNGIFVHNSIFRFRGASMTNILQFKKDYPKAKKIFLKENYRNTQDILNLSYDFITLNDPNRLEYQLKEKGEKLDKKLQANIGDKGTIEVIEEPDTASEIARIVNKIAQLKIDDKEATWDDFAILARSNEQAKEACSFLDEAKFPYLLHFSRGLYSKPVVLNVINYFRALRTYHNNAAMFRVLNLPVFEFDFEDIVSFNYLADKKTLSLYQVLDQAAYLKIAADKQKKIDQFLSIFKKHAYAARDGKVSDILIAFLYDTGYIDYLLKQGDAFYNESTSLLSAFAKRIKEFEKDAEDKTVKAFLEELEAEIESGEQGSLPFSPDAGPEAIRIMTVHAAKGLEFKYVFIINLVDKRFPTTERKEQIEIPDALVKEQIPSGDHHLEEERRLFYVAVTRAKKGVFFSWAKDVGGKRAKRPSRFLVEAKLIKDLSRDDDERIKKKKGIDLLKKKNEAPKASYKPAIPKAFSYSQLAAYDKCPRQYMYSFILKVPTRGSHAMSFGKTMHSTMQKIFEEVARAGEKNQESLFGEANKKKDEPITLDECLKIYEDSWTDEWYPDEKTKDKYKKEGKETIKDFYEKHKDNWPDNILLEKRFLIKVKAGEEEYSIKGQIDRIDQADDKIKLIDYKTGKVKDKLDFSDKEQLLIYQLAADQYLRQSVASLTFHYLKDNSEMSFQAEEKDLEKMKIKIAERIENIKAENFEAKPNPNICKFCDFKDICEYRK